MKNLITVQKYGRKTFGRLRNERMEGLGENQEIYSLYAPCKHILIPKIKDIPKSVPPTMSIHIAFDSVPVGNSLYSESNAPIIYREAKEKIKPNNKLIHPVLRKICLISRAIRSAKNKRERKLDVSQPFFIRE